MLKISGEQLNNSFDSICNRSISDNNIPVSTSDIDLILSITEYRNLLKDYKSTNDIIRKRIQFLEIFSRKIARSELKKYVKKE